jgi:antirestriction protein ArdC
MWSAEARLTTVTRADHAAYLGGWLRILRADPRHLLTVASRAQRALDHLSAVAGRPPTPSDA